MLAVDDRYLQDSVSVATDAVVRDFRSPAELDPRCSGRVITIVAGVVVYVTFKII
jgi:hypothetical protein